jgi:hypothetical protein
MRSRLREWAARVRDGATEDEFVAEAEAELAAAGGESAAAYIQAGPLWQSYQGLKRYWDKKSDAGRRDLI